MYKEKRIITCEAAQMYSKSQLFSKAVRYVENNEYDDWLILSAKYGLLQKGKELKRTMRL